MLAAALTLETFELCQAARLRAREVALLKQAQEEARAQLEREAAAAAVQGSVQASRLEVVETIFTLHCPSCDQVFVDFTNCFALTCGRCDEAFCAWCIKGHGKGHPGSQACHAHVLACDASLNPGDFFALPEQFEACHASRRARLLRAYLAGLQPGADELVRRVPAPCCALACAFAPGGADRGPAAMA